MKENPTFWKYLKNKIWIIILGDLYLIFINIPKSAIGIDDFGMKLAMYFAIIPFNLIWIGVYYFLYRNKLKEYKKLLKEVEKKKV